MRVALALMAFVGGLALLGAITFIVIVIVQGHLMEDFLK